VDGSDRRHVTSVRAKRYGIRITGGARLLAIDHPGYRLTWPGTVGDTGIEPVTSSGATRGNGVCRGHSSMSDGLVGGAVVR
jgi:hypothetical protein